MPLSAFWYFNAKRYLEAVGNALKQAASADLLEAYKGFINICKENDEEEMVEALWHLRFAWADYQDKIEGTTKNSVFERTCKEYEKGVDYAEDSDSEDIDEFMEDYNRWSVGEIDDDGNEVEDK
jgi:hypothetical protein